MAGAPSFSGDRETQVNLALKSAPLILLAAFACDKGYSADQTAKSPAQLELEKSKARADHASERDRCYANVEVVRNLVEVANEQFIAGYAEQGQKTVKEAGEYSERAKEASRHSDHKLKQAEITLRKAQRRLDDLKKTLAFEDRAPVDVVVKQIEDDRQELLHQLFRH